MGRSRGFLRPRALGPEGHTDDRTTVSLRGGGELIHAKVSIAPHGEDPFSKINYWKIILSYFIFEKGDRHFLPPTFSRADGACYSGHDAFGLPKRMPYASIQCNHGAKSCMLPYSPKHAAPTKFQFR